jgi:hypothetical protein
MMKWHWSSFKFFDFSPLIIILPLLHTHPSLPHDVCDTRTEAAYYHTTVLVFILDHHFHVNEASENKSQVDVAKVLAEVSTFSSPASNRRELEI